ncbi:BofC C-terminal domain-containing protein [Cohnella sp. JJ-181]|uniref:BofC C-terminal domain-containing protein n=1 Tax=Cohnella rhizoplanae TaxID=2974897 RepID=UPI00232DAEF1|nr:BofC C-terminal domain-containing protein [Cohnella sp. JJ-181]
MKRLKRNKRHVWSLGAWAAAVLTAAAAMAAAKPLLERAGGPAPAMTEAEAVWLDKRASLVSFEEPASERGRAIAALAAREGKVEVVLRRMYVCGEETRRLGSFSSSEAMALLKAHRDWTASLAEADKIVMRESVDDLSAACKASARIGLDSGGNLSLFDGPVRKDKVIRTFFHMDVKAMESGMSPDELRKLREGMPIGDDGDYRQVVKRLGEFADRQEGDRMPR